MSDEKKRREGSSAKGKKQASGAKARKSWNDFTFINLNLSRENKDQLKAMDADQFAIDEWLEMMLDDGHKLSIKFESKSGAYFATLTGVTEKCPNYGLIMTSRAPSYPQCLLVLFFKCETLLGGLPWPEKSNETDIWS